MGMGRDREGKCSVHQHTTLKGLPPTHTSHFSELERMQIFLHPKELPTWKLAMDLE